MHRFHRFLMVLLLTATAHAAVPGTEIFIPSVAEAPGASGSHWYTTVWIHNTTADTAHVTVSLLRRNQANTAPETASLEVGPGRTVRVDRALSAWFGAAGAVGAIRLESDRPVTAFARVYNQTGGEIEESQGQLLAGYPATLSIGSGESTDVPGVGQGTDGSFRTNFGMVETAGAAASVDVTLIDGDGTALASRRYDLEPYEAVQLNLADLGAGTTPTGNGLLRFAVRSGCSGRIIPFGSIVANGTSSQDPSTLEMEFSAQGGSGEGLDRVHHDATLSGDGTAASPLGVADGGITSAKLSPDGSTPGQVLKASADGVVWSDETGLTLPWSGSGDTGGSLFALTQQGAGYGLQVDAPNGFGIVAEGFFAAGTFGNTAQGNDVSLGLPGYGVMASGTEEAGHFESSGGSGEALLATGDTGLVARGTAEAGRFERTGGQAVARLCTIDSSEEFGVFAIGSDAGGVFSDADERNGAKVGDAQGFGIYAVGTLSGGWFGDSSLSATTAVATSNGYGIEAGGDSAGGRFETSSGSGNALIAIRNHGIEAFGSEAGGFFQRTGSSSDWASLGAQDHGVVANGRTAGGYFTNSTGSGKAWASREGWGMFATGNWMGAQFEDGNDGTKTYLAFGTETVAGTGSKSFVQNDPDDPDAVIVYSAIEGPEVGTYTRGTARLEHGRAVVTLDPTFARVTNPDVGLTATVTPRAPAPGLHVERVGTSELVVASADPECDAVFDYLVMGLRIGFESVPVVRPRLDDAPLPSMDGVRRLLEANPDLRRRTPLHRHREMAASAGLSPEPGPSRAPDLVRAIGEASPSTGGGADHRWTSGREPDPSGAGRSGEHVVRMPAALPRNHLAVVLGSGPSLEPGTVVALEPGSDEIVPATADRAFQVVGVAVDPPSGSEPPEGTPVAIGGVVSCLVDADYGAVLAGDLLVPSPTPGHAMRASDPAPGTVIGKALEDLTAGTRPIRVLVSPR